MTDPRTDMDQPLTIRAGMVVAGLCGALMSLIAFVSSGALSQINELGARMGKAEAAISLVTDRQEDTKLRLQRIEEKLDRLAERASK